MASEAITRIAALERRQRQLLMSIALVLLVALAWPLIALRYFAPQKREPQDQVSGSQPKDHPDHSGTSDAP
jgi:predicted metal-binding membrane protein